MTGYEELRAEIKQRLDTVDEAMLYKIFALLEADQPTATYWWDELDSDVTEG